MNAKLLNDFESPPVSCIFSPGTCPDLQLARRHPAALANLKEAFSATCAFTIKTNFVEIASEK